ncbi:TlpA family protein disulfide reductase [Sabulilitoribacter multivorans]|uniref:TlpA family protein disulfide reductase n=1 Tax=Flaviramulus multivorans TaxID=1304750 RepID=A0ABS9ILH1_9FLAO|nr:TlpA disulfide reductase family protein [Flaviramulus multivorans]MCF7561449.1 TlpA family protein disulfide reductase [Flaviramulus multivorans]
MKKVYCIILLLISFFSCNTKTPTAFTEEALSEVITTPSGETITLKNVLEEYKGKVVLIDVWASWCRDCLVGLPKVKALQNEFKNDGVEFVFLSVDRNVASWKRSVQKYNIQGNHYFINSGQKGPFSDFLNSNWIPRYMVIDKAGSIELFKAKNAEDSNIVESIKKSL